MFPQKKLIVSDMGNTSGGGNSNSSAGSMSVSDAPSNAQAIIENDGFYALSQLDSNQDGIIDTNDNNFNQIKVWRDLNQDGISQEIVVGDKLDQQEVKVPELLQVKLVVVE